MRWRRMVVAVVVLGMSGCASVQPSPTAQQDLTRSVAAVKVALTGAYQMTADLMQAQVISPDKGRDVYVQLTRAERALTQAEASLMADPTNAQRLLTTALQITVDVLAELHEWPQAPPPMIGPTERVG